MKKTIQIEILNLGSFLAIYSPNSLQNNEHYKLLGGHFDSLNQRWLVPNGATAQFKIAELFGQASPSVIACVTPKDLVACGCQLQTGGYVTANWDERNNSVWLHEGVEVLKGAWDLAASTTSKVPSLSSADDVLTVVLRRDFAEKHGLESVEELPEEDVTSPLSRYADNDLQSELENRGYRVAKRRQF